MKMKKGKFIVIEGLDGCGKSTISKNLENRYNAIILNALPKEVKPWLKKIGNTKLAEATFSYFTLCNILNSKKIEKLINSGQNVILDRYFYTTYVYHKIIIKEKFPEVIKDVYLDLLKPDIVVFLDVPQAVRVERIEKRNGELQWYGDAISIEHDLTESYFELFEELNANSFIVDNHKNSIMESLDIIYKKIDSLK